MYRAVKNQEPLFTFFVELYQDVIVKMRAAAIFFKKTQSRSTQP
jgi:hypothetical protein